MLIQITNIRLLFLWGFLLFCSIGVWESIFPYRAYKEILEERNKYKLQNEVLDKTSQWMAIENTEMIEKSLKTQFDVINILDSLKHTIQIYKLDISGKSPNQQKGSGTRSNEFNQILESKKKCLSLNENSKLPLRAFGFPNVPQSISLPLSTYQKDNFDVSHLGFTQLVFKDFLDQIPEKEDQFIKQYSNWRPYITTCALLHDFIDNIDSSFISKFRANPSYKYATSILDAGLRTKATLNGTDPLANLEIKPQLIYLVIGSDAKADRLLYPTYASPFNESPKYPPGSRPWWKLAKLNDNNCKLTEAYGDIFNGGIVRTLACGLGVLGSIPNELTGIYGGFFEQDHQMRGALLIDFILDDKNPMSLQFMENFKAHYKNISGYTYPNNSFSSLAFPSNIESLIHNLGTNPFFHTILFVAFGLLCLSLRLSRMQSTKIINEAFYGDVLNGTQHSSAATEVEISGGIPPFGSVLVRKSIPANINHARKSDERSIIDWGVYTFVCAERSYVIMEGFGVAFAAPNFLDRSKYIISAEFDQDFEPLVHIVGEDTSTVTDTYAPFIKRHLAFTHALFSWKSVTWGFGTAWKRLLELESGHKTSVLELKYGIPERIGPGYLRTRLHLRDAAFLYRGKNVIAVMHMQDLEAYIEVNLNDILAVLRSTAPFSSDRYVIFPTLDCLDKFKSKHSIQLEQIRKEFEKPPFVALVCEEIKPNLKANATSHATHFIIVNQRYVIEIDGVCSLEGDCHKQGSQVIFNEKFMWANFRFRSTDVNYYIRVLSEYISNKYEKHSIFNI